MIRARDWVVNLITKGLGVIESLPLARSFALIALALWGLSEAAHSLGGYFMRGEPYFNRILVTILITIVFWWIFPVLFVYKIERRDARSLGLTIERKSYLRCAILAIVGLILPTFFVRLGLDLVVEFLEQVLYIGLAEEFFYRGYLLNRFCQWLGKGRGLLLSALLFGLGHLISRLATMGLGYMSTAFEAAMGALVGGLLFGYIFLRADNIWPSAILHVSANMYVDRILALF
jgi:membrane protease YdiL (CAAX protease family)